MEKTWEISWGDSFLSLDPKEWNELIPSENPFYKLEFLQILERSGCIGSKTSWKPRPLLLREEGRLVAAIVFFIRLDSYGEYIFDFEWAAIYSRFGFSYYPRLVSAVPFTPVTTSKLLTKKQDKTWEISHTLLQEAIRFANEEGCSTIHILFHREEEKNVFQENLYENRLSYQFHWVNREYKSFEDFLQALKKDRRKSIRKEREFLKMQGIEVRCLEGDEIAPDLWKFFYQLYFNTHSKKWSRPYLTREFFQILFAEFRDSLVLLVASKGGVPVGGSLNFRGDQILYGRYWGTMEDISFLHFECCYYQPIEYAIQKGLVRFEAGAQGEHKYLRGFEVVPIHSSHYFVNSSFREFFTSWLREEKVRIKSAIHAWNLQSPLKIFREKEEGYAT